MSQWLQFITLRPNVVLIDTKSKAHVIRHKETNDLFQKVENIPEHLKKV
jgi:diaminopimelate decarboxylase